MAALTQLQLWPVQTTRANRSSNLRLGKLTEEMGFGRITGQSAPILFLIRTARLLAQRDSAVLIEGETVTGKELVASGIHYCSRRASGPFVAVNCGAVPADLFEHEFFGSVAGAFTGARN